MGLRIHEVQAKNKQAQKTRAEHSKSWDNIDGVLHYQGLLYIPKIIWTELISSYYDNLLAGHFGIKKTRELIARKYYCPTFCHNVEDYVKGCNICLASKAVRHKLYGDLQSLPVPTHHWKDLLMDFVTGLLVLMDWKRDNYDSRLVIVNRLTKMVHYKPVKVTIYALGLAEVIIDMVVRYHGLPNSIVIDKSLLFILKFWSLLCYFVGIKQRLSTTFYPQTNSQTKRQNSMIKSYLQTFVNFE